MNKPSGLRFGGLIYVAGPMTGYKDFNFPAFDVAAAALRAQGWEVVSPAEHDRDLGFDPTTPGPVSDTYYADVLRWDIGIIARADAIYMMDGWEASKGATAEHTVARALKLLCFYQSPINSRYVYGWSAALPRSAFSG